MLNELRVQYARRHQFRTPGMSVDGPAVTVTGIAEFGGARIGDSNSVGFDFTQGITQVIDNVSRDPRATRASRAASTRSGSPTRACAASCFSTPSRRSPPTRRRRAARIRSRYTNLQQQLGDLSVEVQLGVLRVLRPGRLAAVVALKLLYGAALRPVRRAAGACRSRPTRTRRTSRSTRTTSGRAPGISWSLDQSGADSRARLDRPDVRAAAARLLRQRDPEQRRSQELQRRSAACPRPPARRRSRQAWRPPPPGFVLPRQSINAVDPDFRTQSAWLSNVQIERALNDDDRR